MSENTGSVTVMRSHDYCHFSITLPLPENEWPHEQWLDVIDDVRKDAARLVDKAVKQYRIAKANASRLQCESSDRQSLVAKMERIAGIAEGERTVDQQAQLKAFKDAAYVASHPYDYEDAWSDDEDDGY